jgi:hypothetical protein
MPSHYNLNRKKQTAPGFQDFRAFGGGPVVSDPSNLTPTPVKRQPNFVTGFQAASGGGTRIIRQTAEQAARPPTPAWVPGPVWDRRSPPNIENNFRTFQTATRPAGFDATASQFPWELRRGISSDASRQSAFRFGFGGGEGRTGFARRSPDTFFDPRFMFDIPFKNFELQERLRRQRGL